MPAWKETLNAHETRNTGIKTVTKQVPKFTKDTAQLYPCKWLLYNKVTKMYDHTVVNHSIREYITDSISTNTSIGIGWDSNEICQCFGIPSLHII